MKNFGAENGAISKKVVLLIVLGVLAIASLIFMFASDSRADSVTTANRFMGLVTKNNAADSYAMLSDDYKKTVSKESWEAQLEIFFANYKGSEPLPTSQGEVKAKAEGSAVLSQELTYKIVFDKLGEDRNVTYKTTLTLIQDGTNWKIDKFNNAKQ